MSSLEGTAGSNLPLGSEIIQPLYSKSSDTSSLRVNLDLEPSFSSRDSSMTPKIFSNRNTQRRLAQEIAKVHHLISHNSLGCKPLVELRKHQVRPPACSFLGSQAAQVPATVNFLNKNPTKVIIDSESNITLILQKSLSEMQTPIKLQQGQQVNLVQVTGNASISGYVNIDLYFQTPDGPIKINVEAYVVKDMSTPIILGNDFADQYSISVIGQEWSCMIEFGDSDRRMPMNNSVSPPFLDKVGHTFKLHVLNSSAKSTHRKNQRFKCKNKFREHNRNVGSAIKIIIPPETSVAVPVLANFPSGLNCLYIKKVFSTNQNADDMYAPPDSLILKKNYSLHIVNFSATWIPGLTAWENTPLQTSRKFMCTVK